VRLDSVTSPQPLRRMPALARAVESAGFGGLWLFESGRTAYPSCAVAAISVDRIDLGTAIALAFVRSPMITAQVAWELAEATGGRFRIGLGTQVKAHIERRYGMPFEHPGPRLREYVLAMKAMFRAFRREEKPAFEGDFYRFTLLPDQWSPGPIDVPDPPIYTAGVNPWMLRMCGEVADGLHVHPLHTQKYLADVIRPNIAEGARRAGRDATAIQLACPVFTIVGDTDEEQDRWRQEARIQMAFYGSTRSYRHVFEIHGWDDVPDRLHELQRNGDVPGMAALMTDEMVDEFTITATWDGLAEAIRARYDGIADQVIAYSSLRGWDGDPASLERWAAVARAING
jgi:probable F420-dependent oxidoreductase